MPRLTNQDSLHYASPKSKLWSCLNCDFYSKRKQILKKIIGETFGPSKHSACVFHGELTEGGWETGTK